MMDMQKKKTKNITFRTKDTLYFFKNNVAITWKAVTTSQ